MKKILLINPDSSTLLRNNNKSIPINLLYLGSALKSVGFEVKITDFTVGDEIDPAYQPDLVGITCFFSGRFKATIEKSKEIKKIFNVPVIIGGIHPTIYPKEILEECNSIDYVCIGEGEETLVKLAKEIPMENIDGIAYRKDNSVIVNEKKTFIENLDSLPFPDYSLIDLKKYTYDGSKLVIPKQLPNAPIPIVSSRSCPNLCTFCSMYLVHGKRWRARSAKNVVDEIEYLYKNYNQRYFSFMDDNLTLSKKRILEICNEIKKRGLKIYFDTPNGVSIKTLDREVIESLINAGMEGICVAPESGSDFIRNELMGKNTSSEKIFKFFEMIKDYKRLFVRVFFIIGYPEETKETLEATKKMIEKIAPSVDSLAIFNVVPFPGTALFERCKKNRLLNLPEGKLYNLDYFSNYNDSENAFIKPYSMEIDDLSKFRKECYQLFEKIKKKR